MWNLVEFGGMTKTDVANKLVYFRVDGVTIFQGFKNVVTTKLMHNHVPFMSGVHYITHYINLVVQTLSSLSLVGKIKCFLTSMHNYFAHSPKHHLEQISWLNSLNAKEIRFSKTSRHVGFQWYRLPRKSSANIKLWL
jgi:hypothetical protein